MNINRINKISQIYENHQIKKVGLNGNKSEKDKLDLSNKAIEYQSAFVKIKELPKIRENKVKKIEDKIKTGSYKIDSKGIVKKMINRTIFDEKV